MGTRVSGVAQWSVLDSVVRAGLWEASWVVIGPFGGSASSYIKRTLLGDHCIAAKFCAFFKGYIFESNNTLYI